MEITNRLICALRYILAFVCAEQLARCWTRSCCRWPRCWTRRQMNLRAPQETRYSLTPSLIYWSHYKHPLLLSKLWAFIFYFFPFILSLFFSFFFWLLLLRTRLHHALRRWAINSTPLCFRRDGTRRGYCTPGRRWVAGGWGRAARLIPPQLCTKVFFSPL